jgi:hypothetical protein
VKESTHFHWSKDFVEHLRVVHFTLALISLVLLIAGLNGLDSRLPTALTQIQQIAKFEKQWGAVPSRLYEQAMNDNKLKTDWLFGLIVILPPDYLRQKEMNPLLRVPADEILKPLQWKFGDKTVPEQLSTLADFRNFWNDLHGGMILTLVKKPTKGSSCDEFIRVTNTDGSTDVDSPDFEGPRLGRLAKSRSRHRSGANMGPGWAQSEARYLARPFT